MLLSDGDLGTGSSNAACSDGVQPGCRHFRRRAEAPKGAIEWPHFEQEEWLRRRPKEPVQLTVVPGLLLQNL
jgi:hypothetical protein